MAHSKQAPIETRRRLSQSVLWTWQRNFFERRGMQAWSTGVVPHHVTSNPFIADAYARLVFGFQRDCSARLDPTQPLYVVELGSGPGRLAYLFLKKITDLLRDAAGKDVAVTYVMTDFAQVNVEHWRDHKWLQPFMQLGMLDVARFDAERDDQLQLVVSGRTLSRSTLHNPLIVLANYVFDGIPQDAFIVEKGQLLEKLVTVSCLKKETDLTDPELLSRVEISFDHHAVEDDYYEDPEWNEFLRNYRERLPTAEFLFPVAALRCLRCLDYLSSGRMMLMSADRGYNSMEALLAGQGAPAITRHGSFSMMVDYHMLGQYFLRRSGVALHPSHLHQHLNVSVFLLGNPPGDYIQTRMAYRTAIEAFGPDDFSILKDGIERLYPELTLEQIIAFLRLSAWDYRRFWHAIPVLKSRIGALSRVQQQELYKAMQKIWDSYFPIGEEEDVAFQIATLLLDMEFYAEALKFFGHSVDLYGVEPGTAYNMALCHYQLKQYQLALERLHQALEQAPNYDDARTLLILIQSETAEPNRQ